MFLVFMKTPRIDAVNDVRFSERARAMRGSRDARRGRYVRHIMRLTRPSAPLTRPAPATPPCTSHASLLQLVYRTYLVATH